MIEQILIISMTCLSVHFLTREDSILGYYQQIIVNRKGNLRSELLNPLTECLACMASFWTCVDFCMTDIRSFGGIYVFLGLFWFILMASVLMGEKYAVISKILYFGFIVLFVCFFSFVQDPTRVFVVMFCVNGLNSFLGKIIAFYDDCQELREMSKEDLTDS